MKKTHMYKTVSANMMLNFLYDTGAKLISISTPGAFTSNKNDL